MNYYVRVHDTIHFVGMIIAIAFLWAYIAKKLENRYSVLIESKKGKSFIIAGSFLVQLAVVTIIAFQFQTKFLLNLQLREVL